MDPVDDAQPRGGAGGGGGSGEAGCDLPADTKGRFAQASAGAHSLLAQAWEQQLAVDERLTQVLN